MDPRKTWDGRGTEPLRDFFSSKRLNRITADDIRQFQAHRLGQGKHPSLASPLEYLRRPGAMAS